MNKPTRDAIDRDRDSGAGNAPNVNRTNNGEKPARDRDGRGDVPNVNQGIDGDKPARDRDGSGNTLGGAKPGEALIKPVKGDPEVLQGFKPGRLNSNDDVRGGGGGGGGMGSVDRSARDPEVVRGLRNRDVRGGDAEARQRIHSGEKFVSNSHSSCGHSFCGGHGGCVFDHGHHHHGHHDHDGWSFSFGFSSSYWGLSFGYNDWYYAPSYCYDWPHYYYYRPYSYGCYFPRYTVFSSYNYAPYPYYSTYWWLYDNDDYAYSNGYSSGYSRGYEAGMDSYSDVGSYQPTWLAGGASTSGAATTEPYMPPAREMAPSNDGWDLLLAGDVREARRAFDRDVQNAPGDGLPQIGYAITAGLLERYDEAVASMRKALRDDPDAFRETPRDVKTFDQMRTLLTHYRNVTRDQPEDIDGLFMTAALRHLMGEDALAYFSISLAIEAGDKDESAVILKRLTQRALDAEPQSYEPAATTPATVPSIFQSPAEPVTDHPF